MAGARARFQGGGYGLLIASALVVGAIAGCEQRSAERAGPGVAQFESDDAGMNAAIAQARAEVDRFVQRLALPAGESDYVTVKVALDTADGREHIWCENVKYIDGVFHATIANDPVSKDHTYGQAVSAPRGEISDWMYVENGVLVGGYTMRYAVGQMAPEERDALVRQLPFRLE